MQANTISHYLFNRPSAGQNPFVFAIRTINFLQVIFALGSVVWALNTDRASGLLSAIFCAGFPLLLAAKALLAFLASRHRPQSGAGRHDLLTIVFAAELLLASLAILTAMTILVIDVR